MAHFIAHITVIQCPAFSWDGAYFLLSSWYTAVFWI